MVREHDLGLIGNAALITMGTIFSVFSLVAYTFKMDHALAFIMGCFGTASFIGSGIVWYFFLTDPQPRHGKRS